MKSMPYILLGLAILAELVVLTVCTLLVIFTPKEETTLRCLLYAFIIWHIFFDKTGLKLFLPKRIRENLKNLKIRFS